MWTETSPRAHVTTSSRCRQLWANRRQDRASRITSRSDHCCSSCGLSKFEVLTFNYSIPNRQLSVISKNARTIPRSPETAVTSQASSETCMILTAGWTARFAFSVHTSAPSLLNFYFRPAAPAALYCMSKKAVVSDFAYQRLQMAARDNCGKSELWYLEIMKNV